MNKLKKKSCYFIYISISLLCVFCAIKVCNETSSLIGRIRMIIPLFFLPFVVVIDYREHIIPNYISGVMATLGIILLAIGYFTNVDGAIAYIYSSLFATIVCTLGFSIISFLTHGGIGIGDIKLLASLAILCGIYATGGTIVFAVILCSITTAILLLFRIKTIHDCLPFGPFIFVGYILSIFLSIY